MDSPKVFIRNRPGGLMEQIEMYAFLSDVNRHAKMTHFGA
jgi:hypothetical protein